MLHLYTFWVTGIELLTVCLSIYLSASTNFVYMLPMAVAQSLLCVYFWFFDDIMFSYYGPTGGVSQQHHTQANATAACYQLHHVLCDITPQD